MSAPAPRCPEYHYPADLRCGLIDGHVGRHVCADASPGGVRRVLYRWLNPTRRVVRPRITGTRGDE